MRIRFWISNLSAQGASLLISWALVTYVFEGATPYIQRDFQTRIANLPMQIGLIAGDAKASGNRIALGLVPRFDSSDNTSPKNNNNRADFIFPTDRPVAPDDNPNDPVGNPQPVVSTSAPTAYPTQSNPDDTYNPQPTDIFRIPWPKDPIFPTAIPMNTPVVYPTNPIYPTTVPTQIRVNPTAVPLMNASEFEREVIRLINVKRSSMGLRTLSADNSLSQAARAWSSTMSSSGNCGHESGGISKTLERAKRYGYRGYVYGETVACLHTSAGIAVEDWFKSASHKEILTSSTSSKIGAGTVGVYHTVIVGY